MMEDGSIPLRSSKDKGAHRAILEELDELAARQKAIAEN